MCICRNSDFRGGGVEVGLILGVDWSLGSGVARIFLNESRFPYEMQSYSIHQRTGENHAVTATI